MNSLAFRLVVATLPFTGLSSCGGPQAPPESAPWLEFDWPEADLLFQRDEFWIGGDGAYSVDLGNGRVLWLFGDSWIDPTGNGTRNGAALIGNSLAIQNGYDPSQATAEFYWRTTPDGQVQAFFPDFDGGRYWPGHGIRVEDRLLLFLLEVRPTDVGLGFEVGDSRAVLVTNPDDNPPDWELEWLETPTNEERIIIGSGSVLSRGGFVYAFGAREPGPRHTVYLVRWRTEDVVRGSLEGMEWWGGNPQGWLPDNETEFAAQPVFREGQTEFTVHYDEDSGAFVEFQTRGFGPATIVSRTAPELIGPWSALDSVFTPPQVHFPRIMIYQGKAHPYLEGADLVVTYCTNSFEFGDHMTERWLYYPRFVRVSGP